MPTVLMLVGITACPPYVRLLFPMNEIFIFVLAMFAGFEVITKVPPTLHTPLMSGANAISGIALIGALVVAGPDEWNLPVILGLLAVIFGTINVVGGFLVTDRMLQMFKKKKEGDS